MDTNATTDASTSDEAWSNQRLASFSLGNNSSATKNSQQELYNKLKAYESRRRLAYASKFDSILLYWKSYCDLLSASLKETSRAQRIVLGISQAYTIYAENMRGIYLDTFLDEKGNIVKDKQKKKKAAVRNQIHGGELEGIESKPIEAKHTVSVLKGIREAQNDLAIRFEEHSSDEEISELIGSLLDTTRESFDTIEHLGSSILNELERTENEVTQAWDAYLNSKSGVVDGTTEESSPKVVIDPWVVEMQYRVAVTYQNVAWEKGNDELTKLFNKVKEEEITRRMNLREFLVAFAQRQQRLFLSLPGIQNKVLEELAGNDLSRNDMEKAVYTIIEERTSKYKRTIFGVGNVTASEDDFADFNLESPLTSDLLSKAKVVLRKAEGGDWTLSLAVMSADSFLHMFDIESPRVKLTTSPEVAFTLLAPTLIIPNVDNQMLGKSNFGRDWSDPLTPTESMILGKCRVKRLDDNCFEMVESLSLISKFAIGKTARRRIQIQTPTKEETDDWIHILTA